MATFDIGSVDLGRSKFNSSSSKRWRNTLVGLCIALSFIKPVAAHAETPENIALGPNMQSNLIELSNVSMEKFSSDQDNLNDDVAKSRNIDQAHAITQANTVFIIGLTSDGRSFLAGSGTFLKGTTENGYPMILTARHVVDTDFISTAKDRKFFGRSLAFNSNGQLLGVFSKLVIDLPELGLNKNIDDVAALVGIDTSLPYNKSLLDQMSGVPLYGSLPYGYNLAVSHGEGDMLPGASGSGIIYEDIKSGRWGIVGVVSAVVPEDQEHPNLKSLKGDLMFSKIAGAPITEQVDVSPSVAESIIIGLGNLNLIRRVSSSSSITVRQGQIFENCFSYSFSDEVATYVNAIKLSPTDRPNYAVMVTSERALDSDAVMSADLPDNPLVWPDWSHIEANNIGVLTEHQGDQVEFVSKTYGPSISP